MQKQDKIVIITGANSGIGKAATYKFAREGYKVIMACRNKEKAERVRKMVVEETGNPGVELYMLDVSSFSSVKDFCNEFKVWHDRLDILVHNAGYFNHGEKQYQLSVDHVELTFATNTFGPFLMTLLLKDSLSRSADPRVLYASTTNIKHYFDPRRSIDYQNLRGEKSGREPYNVYKLYGDSKMATLLLASRFAEEFQPLGIKVNSVLIPNVKISPESRKKLGSFYWKFMATIINPLAMSPEQMADVYYEICTSNAFSNVTGKLVNNRLKVMDNRPWSEKPGEFAVFKELIRMTRVPAYALNKENMEKIWTTSIEITRDGLSTRD